MDLGLVNAAIAMKDAQTMSRVQVAVAIKVMDVTRQNGDAALQLLNVATKGVAQPGNALVAAATGLGGSLDMYA